MNATDWKNAAEKINALLAGNDQLRGCYHYTTTADETGAESDEEHVELVFWMTHGAKDEAQLYDALGKAADIMGEPCNYYGNGDGTTISGWSRTI